MCAATGRVDVFDLGLPELVVVPGTDRRCPSCRGRRGVELDDEELGASYPSWIGMGSITRGAHETAIVARPIGGRAPERLRRDVRSVFAAPLLFDVDGELGRRGAIVHSAKPTAFYRLVERLYAGPYVEIFGRRSRAGWRVLGDEDQKLDEVERKMREVWPARVRAERLALGRRQARRGA
jgi:hypothetical protein